MIKKILKTIGLLHISISGTSCGLLAACMIQNDQKLTNFIVGACYGILAPVNLVIDLFNVPYESTNTSLESKVVEQHSQAE